MIDSQMVDTARGKLHVRVIGSGPPVILLHGFPDSSLGFRDLCEALAKAGFRAIAPDMRGYGLSDKPLGLENYKISALLEDIADLVRFTGEPRVALLGHDWGGALAFCFAAQHPELLRKLVVMNAPHAASYFQTLRSSLQLFRSWYMLLFLLGGFADWLVTRRWFFRWMLRELVARRDRLSEARVDAARRELLRPGVATAALNYYRAVFRWPIRRTERIVTPTLIIWGESDPTLDVRLLDPLGDHIDQLTVQRIEGAGHFVHWDEPERVADELCRFLSD